MVCPIRNKSFQDLVAKVGPGRAALSVSLPDNFSATSTEIEAKNKIRQRVVELGVSYYAQSYPTLLAPYLNQYTVDEVVDGLYSRLEGLEGTVTDERVGQTPLIPTPEVKVLSVVPTVLDTSLKSLSRNFSFPYVVINRPEVPWKGKFIESSEGKKAVINLAHATPDTPFHEYYHPFVRELKETNSELYSKIVQEASEVFPNMEEEEMATEYLGRLAAARSNTSLLRRFLNFISSKIYDAFKVRFGVTSSTKLGELVDDLLSKGADVKSTSLREAFQAFDVVADKIGVTKRKVTRDGAFLSRLRMQGDALSTSDLTDYYSENGVEKYRRATSFVSSKTNGEFTHTFANGYDSVANYLAAKAFAQRALTLDDTIEVGGKKFKFDDFVKYYEDQLSNMTIEGKLKHSYFDYLTNKDKARRESALRWTVEYAKKLGVPYDDIHNHPYLKGLAEDYKNILIEHAGVRLEGNAYDDDYDSEITVASDLLVDAGGAPLATTIDLLTQSYNGDLRVVDFKTGSITYAYDTSALLKHGEALGIRDSKLSRAFLELAIRAVIIKEKNPEAKFSGIRIVKLDRFGNHEHFDGDLALYLNLIGNYYRSLHPKVYAQMVERGLLDIESYRGTSTTFKNYHEIISGMSNREAMAWVDAEMNRINAIPRKNNQIPELLKDELTELAKLKLELEGITDVEVDLQSGDKNNISKAFGNLSDINKKSVQGLHKVLIKARDAENKERNEVFEEWDKKLDAFYKEEKQYGKYSSYNNYVYAALLYGVGTMSAPVIGISLLASYFIKRANGKSKQTFSFMLAESKNPVRRGYYLNTTDTHPVTGAPLTKVQKELRDHYVKVIHSLYEEVANEIVGVNDYGKPITKAQSQKIPDTLPDDFFARVPMSLDEAKENASAMESLLGIKTSAEHFVKSSIVSMLERDYSGSQKDVGVRMKWMGHESQIENENHSFNPDLSFKLFASHLIHKKHFDTLYPFAQGIRNLIDSAQTPDGRKALPHILEMVDSQIIQQILREPKQSRFLSRDIRIKVNDTMSKILKIPPQTYVVSQEAILRQLKSSLSFVSMGFKLIGGMRNLAIITITNGMQMTSSLVGKISGLVPDDKDSRNASTVLAFKDYASYIKDAMTGDLRKNKLYLLAKEFEWFPDNYDYTAAKSDLLVDTSRPNLSTAAFLFHNFTETYGMLVHLAAIMRQSTLENNGEKYSMWDAYDVKDGKLVWTKGKRGVTAQGDVLEGLDAMEIKTLKRAYERLHGSYRQEERVAMESTVLGQFVTQFRRYFYRYLINNFGSAVDDISIGKYVESKTMKRPDGVPVYEWENQVMQGRLVTAAAGMFALAKGKRSSYFDDRTGIDKRRRLAELINIGVWILGLMLVYAGFDDDDEDTKKQKFIKSTIKDSAQGLHYADISGVMKQPVVFLSRSEQIMSGIFAQFGSDKRASAKGRSDLAKNIPIFSNAKQIKDLFGDLDDSDGYIPINK